MNTRIKKRIIELANSNKNEEICGYIYYTENPASINIYECKNISFSTKDSFEIDIADYLKCSKKGIICGVYHSHIDGVAAFSEPDLEYIEEMAVPLYMYDVVANKWNEYIPPTYHVNLEGLPFIWGLYDCYSIVRNHFRQNLGVYLNDYDRAEDFASNDSSKLLIINNIETEKCEIVANFADLSKIKNGDVLLFKTPSRSRILPVHFGIFLGNSQFLHHPEDQLSRIDLLDNSWLSRVMYIIRAKNR